MKGREERRANREQGEGQEWHGQQEHREKKGTAGDGYRISRQSSWRQPAPRRGDEKTTVSTRMKDVKAREKREEPVRRRRAEGKASRSRRAHGRER